MVDRASPVCDLTDARRRREIPELMLAIDSLFLEILVFLSPWSCSNKSTLPCMALADLCGKGLIISTAFYGYILVNLTLLYIRVYGCQLSPDLASDNVFLYTVLKNQISWWV